jgi:hypothetical protein
MPLAQRPVGDSTTSKVLDALQSRSAKTAASVLAAAASAAVLGWAIISGIRTRSWPGSREGQRGHGGHGVRAAAHPDTPAAALRRKLDEVLHALPEADDRLISLESSPGERIANVERRRSDLRDHANSEIWME